MKRITTRKGKQMRDIQLHNAIREVPLNEKDRRAAMAAMETAEEFADAVMWLMRALRTLRGSPGRAVLTPHEHVEGHIGL